jgi:adenylate cyclase
VVKAVLQQRADQEVVVPRKRKSLTVFRIKLHGFDVMMEQLEPESQAAVLNSYLSAMAELAFAHGATVDGFVQDTVMGFFGAPSSSGSEDDARRCARAVLEMWGRAETMCRQWQDILSEESLVPTAVLASGYATVGTFGSSNRLDYTAVGGPQDDASALLSAAPAGAVTCTQSTWTLIKGEVEGEPSGEAMLQHRGRKVKLYRLMAMQEGGDG